MRDNIFDTVAYDDEGINYDDIPKITDFSKAVKNPHVGKFIKNGKFTAIIEKAINSHPEQWFWFHKRWKTKPFSELRLKDNV